MPMKVTFELSDKDLEYFRTALADVELRQLKQINGFVFSN